MKAKKIKIQYYWKFFFLREINVGQYMDFILDPLLIRNMLVKKNISLNEMQYKELTNYMFWISEKKKSSSRNIFTPQEEYEDMEFIVTLLCIQLKQPISEILKLPYKSFVRILERIPELLDTSKYKKKTKSPDKNGLREIQNILKK